MILDELAQADLYTTLNPGFAAAVAFVRRAAQAAQPGGRYEIDGGQVYATHTRPSTRGGGGAKLEAHRRYIDIHYLIAGCEEIGWSHTPACTGREGEYDPDRDLEFFADGPDTWVTVHPGQAAIFYPADAHIPLVGTGELHKVILKVACQ
jgi:biofilm protein TabA